MGVRLGAGWQSPATMPRRWLAGLFGVSAIFASLVAIFSSDQVHQLWGAMAACGYGLGVAAVLGWRKRGVDLALGLSLFGALVLPLGWMAAKALEQPEVAVVARSAWTLIHQGSPYAGVASLATTHDPNAYNPYLPVMTLFGLPRAVIGGGALTDPRVWFGLVFTLVFWLALRDGGARHPGRWAVLIAASPVIALELAVGGTDVPMVAFLCLGFALLWGAQSRACRPVLAGLALGVAASMKATAWPAVAVAVALLAVRDGKRAVRAFILTVLAVMAVCIGPFLAHPRSLTPILDLKELNALGTAYRKQVADESGERALADVLLEELPDDNLEFDTAINDLIKKDFDEGNTTEVNGWILSKTEARQCALLTFSTHASN